MQTAGNAGREVTLGYERHRPEQTLLYQIIEQHYLTFLTHLEQQSRTLPVYVQREFEDYFKCGRLEHGFLRVRCQNCHDERLVAFSCKRRGFCPSCGARRMAESAALLVDEVFPHAPIRQWVLSFPFQLRFLFARDPAIMSQVLGLVHRTLSTYLINKAGFTRRDAQTGAVTLVQRFGSAVNLNIHFHMLFLDGVYTHDKGMTRFHQVKAPSIDELNALVHTISHRVAGLLERQGLLERDVENTWLTFDETDEDPLQQIHGHAITYRIAIGPHQGRKVFTLSTQPPESEPPLGSDRVAKAAGFSLHAGVAGAGLPAKVHQRDKLERLCRYISRPAISEKRLSLTFNGYVRYQLKTPYRDGTTHVLFERGGLPPLDFIARLAALVPKPRVNLTRFHGVFVRGGLPPNSKHRIHVTPARRGKGRKRHSGEEDKTPSERHAAMTWAQRLKRVFKIDIATCSACGGPVKVIAEASDRSIEDPVVINKILNHLKQQQQSVIPSPSAQRALLPLGRAPPQDDWLNNP